MTFAIGSRAGERRGPKPPDVFLYAIRLDGDDLWRDPLEVRKATLASVLAKAGPGIRFNEHIEGDGPTVFAHACKISAGRCSPAQLFTGSLWRATRAGHPKWGA
jgi:hypothetical protein